MFTKYYAIVVRPSLVGLEPSIIHDWMAPSRSRRSCRRRHDPPR
jgi:hypothetical protein